MKRQLVLETNLMDEKVDPLPGDNRLYRVPGIGFTFTAKDPRGRNYVILVELWDNGRCTVYPGTKNRARFVGKRAVRVVKDEFSANRRMT